MDFEISVSIDAPLERVWSVLTDVERWPEWTASMRSVTYAYGAKVAVGSKVRIEQPKLPAMVWEVTQVEARRSFSWMAKSGGITTLAVHRVSPGPRDGIVVSLGLRQRGPLAGLVGILTARLTRQYVQMEAQGLKQRCEASS
jgi:uncharacterized protein YndB with AHSA1/START domain